MTHIRTRIFIDSRDCKICSMLLPEKETHRLVLCREHYACQMMGGLMYSPSEGFKCNRNGEGRFCWRVTSTGKVSCKSYDLSDLRLHFLKRQITEEIERIKIMSEEEARQLGYLIIKDIDGEIIPYREWTNYEF